MSLLSDHRHPLCLRETVGLERIEVMAWFKRSTFKSDFIHACQSVSQINPPDRPATDILNQHLNG